MKQNFPSNLLAALKVLLILGILLVGLSKITLSQELIPVSQARAQDTSPPGSIIASTPGWPAVEVRPLSQPVITATASNASSGFTSFKPFGPTMVVSSAITSSQYLPPLDSGEGEYNPPDVPDLTEQQRQEIQKEIDQNIKLLGLQKSELTPFSTALSWPIQAAPGLTDFGYHAIGAFVDHNPAKPNQLQDYNCLTRTYDTSSFNHTGTDIGTWPFGWNKMDNSEVQVIAAAPGTIVQRQDGNSDRSCGFNSNPWNGVVIQHADGSHTWYGHMKKNSVTAKLVGDPVVTGDYLGIVGSSGSSSGPHLHFEVRDAGNNVIDPYAGQCNPISSWWVAQRPYYDSAINALTTGGAAPIFPACPNQTITNIKNQFNPGDTAYFAVYYRDWRPSQQSSYKIYQPDGTIYRSWSNSPPTYYSAAYWYGSYPLGAKVGLWKFEVVFNGQTYTHNFSVGDSLYLSSRPDDQTLYLNWDVYSSLPANSTWQITYAGPPGNQPSPITGLSNSTRSYTLTGLTNYAWYTITLNAMVNSTPIMTDTVLAMPTDIAVYLPVILK